MKERIREILKRVSGAEAVGFAKAEPVDKACSGAYAKWLADGGHAEMLYLENHRIIRNDPRLLLEGAKTVISLAFNYYPIKQRPSTLPYISMYAYGKDYHDVLRNRLSEAVRQIVDEYGGEIRICIDSAPIHERYWAWKSGIGFQGLNGTFILPGKGSFFFLAEILTTLEISPDKPLWQTCGECRRCLDACPGKALTGDSSMNAQNCLSYLTIECRSDWSAEKFRTASLFGCDICQKVCPHNRNCSPTEIKEFFPIPEFLEMDIDFLEQITEEEFKKIFRNSPVKRAKLKGLQRNIEKYKQIIKSDD